MRVGGFQQTRQPGLGLRGMWKPWHGPQKAIKTEQSEKGAGPGQSFLLLGEASDKQPRLPGSWELETREG